MLINAWLALFSEYCCIFGISIVTESYDGFSPGVSNIVYDQDIALGAIIGLNGKVFWFIFIKMDKKYYVPNIPRFTPADADALAEKHKHRKMSKDVTFDDMWRTRTRCTLVALEEGVTETWFNDRTVLLGDSAHKVSGMRASYLSLQF
jgi:FAD dependent monooxygenase